MIVVDTSFLYALLDRRDAYFVQAADWYATVDEDLATTPLVIAEVDHLARTRAGPPASAAFRADVRNGAYLVDWWSSAARESVLVAESHSGTDLSLTDASIIALARRLDTTRIATFDHRHFRSLRPLQRTADAFTVLPTDAAQ